MNTGINTIVRSEKVVRLLEDPYNKVRMSHRFYSRILYGFLINLFTPVTTSSVVYTTTTPYYLYSSYKEDTLIVQDFKEDVER